WGDGLVIRQNNAYSGLVNTVSVGATTATLKDISKASLFTAGQYALLTTIDLQGYGYPPNAQNWDWVLVSNVNAGTGVITFATTPSTYLHKDTFPSFDGGSGLTASLGGPATLYAITPAWNLDLRVG